MDSTGVEAVGGSEAGASSLAGAEASVPAVVGTEVASAEVTGVTARTTRSYRTEGVDVMKVQLEKDQSRVVAIAAAAQSKSKESHSASAGVDHPRPIANEELGCYLLLGRPLCLSLFLFIFAMGTARLPAWRESAITDSRGTMPHTLL